MNDANIEYVRINSATRLCMDCNGIYNSTIHSGGCPGCASQQSIKAQTLIGELQINSSVAYTSKIRE
jgi:Zn finger protein HypA/HybF involved in hydrogenase expression